ncbi:hypothetical protein TNCV_4119501 [Trichonephila clavipes]|nr:hypothetical protein TNCV_4119501 [Trichonephila clavipes]
MGLNAADNNRPHLALCREEFRGTRSGLCRSGENASQVAEIVNSVYDVDTVTASYVQFGFRRFRSDIFDVKDAYRPGKPMF